MQIKVLLVPKLFVRVVQVFTMSYDLDAVAAFAKRRDFSHPHGSSNFRGSSPYYFLQVFERGVSFYRLATILSGLRRFLP